MMYAHLHRTPAPVSGIDRALPAGFDEVLATGLAKDPADRYASAGRLAETPARLRTKNAIATGVGTSAASPRLESTSPARTRMIRYARNHRNELRIP